MVCNRYPKITIFLAEAVCMMAELCASYLFSPYFGTSNLTWTSIIGVILLSAAIGNYIGGRMVIKGKTDLLPFIFITASVFMFSIVVFNDLICVTIAKSVRIQPWNSFLASLALMAPLSVFMGMVPPTVMAGVTKDGNKKGIGLIYMMSTAGGLVGTFIGGYLLIPVMGVTKIVMACGIILLVLGITIKPDKKTMVAMFLSAVMLITGISVMSNNKINEGIMIVDSRYGRIRIYNGKYDDKDVLEMEVSGGYQSATYTDEELHYDIVFDYLKKLDEITELLGSRKLMMIGGAAYQYPKHVLAHKQDSDIDVVEIDGMVTELARQYFYLDDAIEAFDPDRTRLGLYTEDAKIYIRDCTKKYDLIMNDAFAGDTPARTLTTLETVRQIKGLLSEDGAYVMNIISSSLPEDQKFLKAECRTLAEEFKHIYIDKVTPDSSDENVQNLLVTASDREIEGLGSFNVNWSDGIILTDDYCPVEDLIPKNIRER